MPMNTPTILLYNLDNPRGAKIRRMCLSLRLRTALVPRESYGLPLALDEFRRVLRPGGAFLYVVPAADHLWELKQVLYDQPYRNREEDVPYEGFSYERVEPVEAVVDVAGEALRDLFQMTPYYWKTPREGAERLAALDGLRVRASFRVHVFRRR